MQKSAAQRLVQKTLQSSFNKERFVYLVKNLLNHVEEKTFTYRGKLIFDAFADSIRLVERIGQYTGPDEKIIDILIVHLKLETSLEHARTKQRNYVDRYLRSRQKPEIRKAAALVAFVAPNGADWRFSLVKMGYRFNEKGEVEEEITPARRYSFLVGENENSHTAQSRLLPILIDDEVNPSLGELEDAFSVEPVTKEFFEKYRELFLRLKEVLDELLNKDARVEAAFKEKSIDTADFAKKLLGQIVFLYFLQKKGWFGVKRGMAWGSGSRHFLRELFKKKHGDYKNFFNDILEPLFYEALQRERYEDYYSRFDCRIPFLNGGLFDPIKEYDWVNTDVMLPDHLFSNNRKTKEGDTGDGILNIFDRYNFTVKEDEPLEKEVAVDPEMLGKVFENLLEVKDRKSKGTYYTPREIVHYMCQQSLINYLYNSLNPETVSYEKLGDPQVGMLGNETNKTQLDMTREHRQEPRVNKEDIETLIQSGESTIENDSRVVNEGRETERYAFKLSETVRNHANPIDESLASIRVCDPAIGSGAFIVGMMNEIIRARNALTPHIDENGGENGERSPYHFKRQAIQNCLYGVDIDPGAVEIAKLRLWLSLVVDEEEREDIKPLPNLDYKIMQGNSLLSVEKDLFNADLFNKLEELKPLHFNETSTSKKQEYQKQIDELISQITNGRKDFDFEVYFSEIFHEKKGFDVVIANPPYVKKEHLHSSTINELENHFTEEKRGKVKSWSDDLYVHFIFRGIENTRDDGIVSFITNDSFISLSSKRRVRRLLLNHTLHKLIRCPIETFSAMIYTAVFVAQKDKRGRGYESGHFIYPKFEYESLGPVSYNVISTLPNERLIFASPIFRVYSRLLNLETVSAHLKVLDTGIDSGNCRGKIFFKEKVKAGLHRLLQGKQTERWGIFWDRKNAKYKYCDINYRPKPNQKGIGRKGRPSKHNEYWQFRGNIENHHKPERLLMRQSDDDLVVAIQSEKQGLYYTDNTLFTILPKRDDISLKYAMALLNSKLLNTFYHLLSQEEGKTLAQVKIGLVNELPFKIGNPNAIVNIVDKILTITEEDDYLENPAKQAKVHEHEKQIDQLVYQLYDLTDEEIKIVEQGNS